MRLCFRRNKEHLPLHVIYGPSQTCKEVRGGQTRYANRALCLICAAFRITPTEALEIEASIPPIRIQVQLQAKRYAVRLNKLPLTNWVIQRLPDTWRNGNPPTHQPPLPVSNGKQKNKKKISPLMEITKSQTQNTNKSTHTAHPLGGEQQSCSMAT